ncbi:WXG100 family type VII secretion target [Pseudogracilibacillus auburnensis]|uniref:ESAT-6-like protein n=1 Tax=Pseudogracilibacillus auburnensis TaxID=1494959 RepID=A0A2V3VZ68_9BACI|nr:WXG100 family type VII secretion target [Pseudogracilibacillus auburnensis]MBO1002406.1 WXG100 family type VII secretion target [Pseudogracilibacillus auburnensis]PXW86204.1 WXG100 family type VII secretion target [Pseudogracilibacillus auburnensis]
MSGQIKMSPAELTHKARGYGESHDIIKEVLAKLEHLQEDLRAQWEGKAFESFDNQFRELKPKVENFAVLMQEINEQLNKTADAMAEQDQALSQNFGFR